MVPVIASNLVDLWDVDSFDSELFGFLAGYVELVRRYHETDHQIFLTYDLGRGPERPLIRPDNPYCGEFLRLVEDAMALMQDRTIRAYHYTRLTDGEVAELRKSGIVPSTMDGLRRRLDYQVAAGTLSEAAAEALFSQSPFHSEQRDSREHKFWMTSHPTPFDDGGVAPLLAHWGGEVANMWTRDAAGLAALAKIGKPRVLEMEVPIRSTRHSYGAAEAVVATFARAKGAIPEKKAFDLYVYQPLPASAVLAVHTEGEEAFARMGRDYPIGFVDVAIGRWKELTGEDD